MSNDILRRVAAIAAVIVAAIAAIVSYYHIYILSVKLGQPWYVAALMPVSVDGDVVASSAALVVGARDNRKFPMAWLMLSLGVMATLAANGDSGVGHGWPGVILGCWPAVAFVGTTEVALSLVRHAASNRPPTATTGPLVTKLDRARQLVAEYGPMSGDALAMRMTDISGRTGRRLLTELAKEAA